MGDYRMIPHDSPRLLPAVLLALVAAAAVAGCSAVRGPNLTALIDATPALAERPVVVTVPLEAGGRRVVLHDLALDVPADWQAGPVRPLGPVGHTLGGSAAVMIDVVARVDPAQAAADDPAATPPGRAPGAPADDPATRAPGGAPAAVPVMVFYRPERGWLECPPPGLTAAIGHATGDPRRFLARYRTDLNLVEAAYQVRPADLEAASGDARRRAAALLWLKSRLPQPAKRLVLRRGTAMVCHCTADPGCLAALFDAAGRRRGEIALTFAEPVPETVAESLLARLVANLDFAPPEGAAP